MVKNALLLDLPAIAYRGWYATVGAHGPELGIDGTPISATRSALLTIYKLLKEYEPAFVVAALDSQSSWRKNLYPPYKANRSEPDPLFTKDFMNLAEALRGLSIPLLEAEECEADDVIASVCKRWAEADHEVMRIIVTGDKDLFQLVGDRTKVHYLADKENPLYNNVRVLQTMGVPAYQLHDYKTLVGDTSDNLPGVRNIGPSRAKKLLETFGSIAGAYQKLKTVKPASLKAKLEDQRETARLMWTLVALVDTLDVPSLEDCVFRFDPKAEFYALMARLNLKAIAQSYENLRNLKCAGTRAFLTGAQVN